MLSLSLGVDCECVVEVKRWRSCVLLARPGEKAQRRPSRRRRTNTLIMLRVVINSGDEQDETMAAVNPTQGEG
jgi:hypothetical protein